MDYANKLKAFMYAKSLLCNEPELYFDEKDEEWFDKMPTDVAINIYNKIKYSLIDHPCAIIALGLLCPFCIYFKDNCDDCVYAHNHGICDEDGDYMKTSEFIKKPLYVHRAIFKEINNYKSYKQFKKQFTKDKLILLLKAETLKVLRDIKIDMLKLDYILKPEDIKIMKEAVDCIIDKYKIWERI